jgi:hypothetical protein
MNAPADGALTRSATLVTQKMTHPSKDLPGDHIAHFFKDFDFRDVREVHALQIVRIKQGAYSG